MTYKAQLSISTALIALSVTAVPHASAQDAAVPATAPAEADEDQAAQDQNRFPQEIVVTAQRREEALSRVPVSVTALGADDLIQQGVSDPQDLVGIVPGFQATSSYGGNTVYTLRGVGFNTRNPSSTAPIGIYLDQAALPFPVMAQGVSFDLERVEVLKGPQGTLFGRNATGGLINYVAAKPTSTPEGGLTVEVGNFQTVNASAFVSGALSDFIRVRVAADTQNRNEGWQRSVTRNERLGELHQHALRGTLEFGNGGPFSATLTGSAWWRYGDSLAPQAIFYIYGNRPVANPLARASIIANPTDTRDADWNSVINQPQADIGIFHPGPLTDSEYLGGTLNMEYAFSDTVRLVSLSSYSKLDKREVSDAAGLQTSSIFQDNVAYLRSVSQELRLVGDSDRLRWSLGAYVADDRATEQAIGYNDQNGQIATLRGLALILPQTRYTPQQLRRSFGNYDVRGAIDSNVYAVFANADYAFTNQFRLSAGARYTRDDQRFRGCVYDYLGGNVALVNTVYPVLTGGRAAGVNLQPGGCYTLNAALSNFVPIVANEQSEDNISWNVTASFTPSDTSLFYGTVARGFKAGTYPIFAGSVETQFDPVLQEQLTSYELGTKIGLFDRRVQFNLATFYYDYRNKQIFGRVADLIFGTLSRIRNVPKSRVWGVEGDVTIRVTPELTLSGAAAYLDSKILGSFADFTELGAPADFGGRPFAYTPKFQGSATIAYDGPISNALRFNASLTANYQDATQADFAGNALFRIKERTLVNGTIGIAHADGVSLTAYAKNLFDEYYYSGVTSAIDTVVRYPGMPREFGLRASFRY